MAKLHTQGPRAVVVSGPAGSGKTTFATSLASEIGFVLLDLDDVTGPLTAAALALAGAEPDALDGDSAGAGLREARYACLLGTAAANLAVGRGVVVVAPFTRERASIDAWEGVVDALGARARSGGREAVALCYLDCPPDLLLERLASRRARRDRAKIDRPELVRASALGGTPVVAHVRVDAASSLGHQVRDAVAELGVDGGGDRGTLARSDAC
ncbi:MAG: AAA family ATPase [Acidimicrobiales bacterium]